MERVFLGAGDAEELLSGVGRWVGSLSGVCCCGCCLVGVLLLVVCGEEKAFQESFFVKKKRGQGCLLAKRHADRLSLSARSSWIKLLAALILKASPPNL